LFYPGASDARHAGYVRIEAGPQHAPYGHFCPAPGHQLGFNDLKTIEMVDFLAVIAGGEVKGPDFADAWRIQKIIDAAILSSEERRWVAA
jgi:predicted dehydrogenase